MKIYLYSIVSTLLLLGGLFNTQAQTVAYRLVKIVSKYGEVLDQVRNQKVYITFTNNKNSFYLSNREGARAGSPDASTGWASGFNNQDVSGNFTGITSSLRVRDPQDFTFSGTENDARIYKNVRPLLYMRIPGNTIYVSDYTVDYVKINSDFSRLNVIPSFEKGMYGLIPFGLGLSGYGDGNWTVFVYEKVESPIVGSGGVFY